MALSNTQCHMAPISAAAATTLPMASERMGRARTSRDPPLRRTLPLLALRSPIRLRTPAEPGWMPFLRNSVCPLLLEQRKALFRSIISAILAEQETTPDWRLCRIHWATRALQVLQRRLIFLFREHCNRLLAEAPLTRSSRA